MISFYKDTSDSGLGLPYELQFNLANFYFI